MNMVNMSSGKAISLWAQWAIDLSKKRFKQDIKISAGSLDALEDVLVDLTLLIQKSRENHQDSAGVVEKIAKSFGALLGEIIRVELGGKWVLRDGNKGPYLVVDNVKVFPLKYVRMRLFGKEAWTVREFYTRTKGKIDARLHYYAYEPYRGRKNVGSPITKVASNSPHVASTANRDKVTAALLSIFLGGIGAHKFYLGEFWLGVLYLVFSWTGIPLFLGVLEGLMLLSMDEQRFHSLYG